MSDIAVEVDHVWKKFHKGEFHDSLRDFLPALAKRIMGRGPKRTELEEDDFWALKDVSFQVKKGEVLGIIGPNGAGKSTMLKVLSRILKPNRGRIQVNGRLRALIEIAAGFHPDLTGRENVYLNGTIMGMKKREIDKKFDEIVDFSGIEEFLDTPVKRYSSGMYARLGFAVAAHLDPEILIVDEVLAVGDYQFQKKCLGKMQDVASEGRTVLFVSHGMEAVRKLCPRCVLLDCGNVVLIGETDEVIGTYLKSEQSAQAIFQVPPPTDNSIPGFAKRVTVEDAHAASSTAICVGRPWQIRVAFTIRQHTEHFVVGVGLRGNYTTPLWTVWSEPREIEPGNYEAVFHNDSILLASGTYSFVVGLSSHERTFHYVDNAGVLQIVDISDGCDRVRIKGCGFILNSMNVSITNCSCCM